MAERICEAAERMPDAFGMSHNAQGEGEENKDGVFVVSKIVEVRHVDLVADPATTKSLSESKKMKKATAPIEEASSEDMKLVQEWQKLYHTSIDNAKSAKTKQGKIDWEYFAILISGIMKDAATKASRGEDVPDPKSYKSGRFSKIKPTSTDLPEATGAAKMDTVEIVSQLKDLLDQLSMSLGGEEEVPSEEAYDGEEEKPAMEAEDEDKKAMDDEATEGYDTPEMDEEPPVEKKKPSMEARQTKAIRNARKLCEAVGLKPSRDLLQDLASMPRETAARQVQRLALAAKARAPRSGSYMTEGRTSTGTTDSAGIPTGPALFTWLAN
jgi:hypothetical protein